MKMDDKSIAARKRAKEWYYTNKERAINNVRKYYLENKEKCLKKSKEYRIANFEEFRIKQKIYNKTPGGIKAIRKAHKNERIKHKLKIKARQLIASAIRNCTLIRLPCKICKNPKSEAHHPDYNKPYKIKWLCNLHHQQAHGQLLWKN